MVSEPEAGVTDSVGGISLIDMVRMLRRHLVGGTIVFEGTPAALRANTQITATYLGVGG